MNIVVIGAVFVDIKGFPYDAYIPAGRNAGNVEFVHGGVGRNVVEDIANLELCPKFVSMVDDTPQGEAVLKKLNNHKVNTDYVVSCPDGMGMWLAVFDETGDVAGSISKRPNMDPLVNLLQEKGDEIFSDCDGVIVEIDIDKDVVKQVFKYSEKYNVPVYCVVANMSIASERRDLFQKAECAICNRQEAGLLFIDDFIGEPEDLCEKLSEKVINANITSMIVTLGSEGAIYANKFGDKGFCPANKVTVRDTTGAGDAFCAGASSALIFKKSLKEAVEIGTRLAASVIVINENTCPRFLPQELGLVDGEPDADWAGK